ncbi:MAG: hypothetical protein KIS82_03325 [Ferruginibacter sp.]|nr:hypothetical protein [Ferruginibacter sp.]
MRKKLLSWVLSLLFVCLFSGMLSAQVYVNGNLSTGTTNSQGNTAPAGFTWSEVQAGNNTIGTGANIDAGYSIADDFTITGSVNWLVDSVKFYAYSTNYSGTTSPFNKVFLQIFNTDPSVGTPTPVWGDYTTNRYDHGVSAKMYRIPNGATANLTARQVWEITVPVNFSLTPGQYWMEWALGTVTAGASNFSPLSTVIGTTTQPGNNAKQHDHTAGTWVALTDAGPQDTYYKLFYTSAGCTGTPVPGATLSTSGLVCPGELFTLSINNPPSNAGITFQWQSSSNGGGPFTDIPGATNSTYTTSQTAVTFYQLVVSCNGSPGISNPIEINIKPANQCYCAASSSDTDPTLEKIDQVIFGSLNNSSTAPDGYEDFTGLTPVPDYNGGTTVPISIISTNSYTGDQVRVWIDFDQSGSFEPTELVYEAGPAVGPYNGNVQIPSSALGGNTRMRVRLFDSQFGNGNNGPCGTETYGQVEDYTINIIPSTGCSGTPTPGATASTETSVCPTQSFTLSIPNPPSNSGITFQWQSAASASGPFADIAGATNSTLTTTQSAATYYQLVVSCNGTPGASAPVLVSMKPANQCYCDAGATNTNPAFEKIDEVIFGDLDNASTSGAGYEDFTGLTPVPDFVAGSSVPLTILSANSYSGDQVKVWIDFNQSGSFEDNELVYYTNPPAAGPYEALVQFAANAMTGNTRMRIRLYDGTFGNGNNGPCGDETYGQVEDYTINILPCEPVTISSQPADVNATCSSNASFSIETEGTAPSFQWQVRTSENDPWTPVVNGSVYSGQGTNTLNISGLTDAMDGYQYQVAVGGGCTAVFLSSTGTLTVSQLVPTVTPASVFVCAGSTAPINITNTAQPTTSPYISSGAINMTIPDDNVAGSGANAGINNSINVTSLPSGALISGLSVKLNIVHSYAGDLIIVLKAPNGQVFNLDYAMTNTGGAGPTTGFTNTVFSSTGTTALIDGTNPYTGTFAPDNQDPADADPTTVPLGPAGFIPTTRILSDLYSIGNGNWTLALYDYYGDGLTSNLLVDWGISFTYGAPQTGIFSPSAGLFTDAAGTAPYTGNAVSSVYAGPAQSGNYSVTLQTPGCASASTTIPVTVTNAITAITVPNITICEGLPLSVTATVTGGPGAYQWEASADNGATWIAIDDVPGELGGTKTNTLTVNEVPIDNNGYQIRLVAVSCGNTVVSNAATLTVNPTPSVSINNPATVYPGSPTLLTASSNPGGAAYQWFLNGSPIAGATNGTFNATVDYIGNVSVKVTDVNGCVNTSSAVTVKGTPNTVLFIYPSPTTGQFSVRYYSEASTTPLVRQVNVYDSKGSRVISKTFSIATQYQSLDIDLSKYSAGIYRVELLDRSGNRIKTGSVIKL